MHPFGPLGRRTHGVPSGPEPFERSPGAAGHSPSGPFAHILLFGYFRQKMSNFPAER